MRVNPVEHGVGALRQSLAALKAQARSATDQPDLLPGMLEQLAGTLDDLQEVCEDLCVQNEELLGTRQALDEELQHYQELFSFAPDGYLLTDLNGIIREANRAAATLLGVRLDYLVRKPLSLYLPAQAVAEFRARMARVQAGAAEPETWELPLQLRTGQRLHAAIRLDAVRDVRGVAVGLRWLIRDATARKRAEEELHRRRRWDQALAAIGQAAVSGDALPRILSRGLEAVAGAEDAPVGLIRLVDPATRELVLAAHRNLSPAYLQVAARVRWGTNLSGMVAEKGNAEIIDSLHADPGLSRLAILTDPRIESLVCVPLQSDDRVIGTLTLGHPEQRYFGPSDVSVLQQAASMLAGAVIAEQLREAARKDAEQKALLYRELDHRVRNNMAALIGLLQLAADHMEGPAMASLRQMADRVARLADSHNLLAGRGVQPVDIRELAAVVARNLLEVLPGGLQIRQEVTGAPLRVLPAQMTPLALILNELLTNCVKHAFPGRATGSVTIQVRRDGEQAGLEVCDDGVGLDPPRDPAGLGIAIVRTLVTESLGGAVWFGARRGGGTLVYLRFPLGERAPLEPAA